MWNTFRTCGRDDQQGAVDWVKSCKRKVQGQEGCSHPRQDNLTARAWRTRPRSGHERLKRGLKEAQYEGINTGEKDYSALVSKLNAGQRLTWFHFRWPAHGGLASSSARCAIKGFNAPPHGVVTASLSSEFTAIAGPGVGRHPDDLRPGCPQEPEGQGRRREVQEEGLRALLAKPVAIRRACTDFGRVGVGTGSRSRPGDGEPRPEIIPEAETRSFGTGLGEARERHLDSRVRCRCGFRR